MARLALAILGVALAAAACGGEDAPVVVQPAPASLAQLTGPWQAQPFALDPVLRRRVEDACRRDMERQPGSVAALVDVRGAGVAVVRMVGPSAGACDALQITGGGQVNGAGGGWTAGGIEQLPAIGGSELSDIAFGGIAGGDLKVEGWSVMGRAGPGISAVVIEPAGGPSILATLQNGWFAGWWPAGRPDQGLGGPPADPEVLVRGFDATGTEVAEVRP